MPAISRRAETIDRLVARTASSLAELPELADIPEARFTGFLKRLEADYRRVLSEEQKWS